MVKGKLLEHLPLSGRRSGCLKFKCEPKRSRRLSVGTNLQLTITPLGAISQQTLLGTYVLLLAVRGALGSRADMTGQREEPSLVQYKRGLLWED